MIGARYTTVLKDIMDDPIACVELEQAMSTYKLYTPIHKELYGYIPNRSELNGKILNHYKYREICFETVGRFIDELETSLNEIMPKYNQWYKSIDIMNNIEDIFANVDVTETSTETTSQDSSSSSSSSTNATDTSTASSTSETNSESENDVTNNSKSVTSTTPQGVLSIGTKGIDSIDHADEAKWGEDTSNSTVNAHDTSSGSTSTNGSSETSSSSRSSSESEDITTRTFNKRGNQGVNTYAHDMNEFRQLFVNVEQMIINDERISELFMRIY